MIRCIIVEDEPLAQAVLENFIGRSAELDLVSKCNNALEAFNVLHNEAVDLMFLDIRMPDINGLDFVRSLKKPPAVIFTTAFSDHAVAGFELQALDYLLKPFTYERFRKSIDRMLNVQPSELQSSVGYTYFKVSGQLIKVLHKDLLYAHSVKDYIMICTRNGRHLTHMTMKYLSELLPPSLFLRIHRSYLINRTFVDRIDRSFIEIQGEQIPVGESYRQMISGTNWNLPPVP